LGEFRNDISKWFYPAVEGDLGQLSTVTRIVLPSSTSFNTLVVCEKAGQD